MSCPCQSQKEFNQCCEPIILGTHPAETAEQMMRARYTAYSQMNMEFIQQSHDPKTLHETDMNANAEWAKKTTWLGLEIVKTEGGSASDKKGIIEFQAKFKSDGEEQLHHEISEFTQRDGTWYFSQGRDLTKETYIRTEKKIGRNEPCPCGSRKKFKKCCG